MKYATASCQFCDPYRKDDKDALSKVQKKSAWFTTIDNGDCGEACGPGSSGISLLIWPLPSVVLFTEKWGEFWNLP